MKKIITSILVLVGISAFAQTTTTRPTTTTTTTATGTATASTEISAKAKALCKTWMLSQTENFGDIHKPTEAQKNDQLVILESGRYRLIKDGASQGGTWTLDKTNVWLTLTADDGTVTKFKIIESTATTLKVDFRDSDDIHNILYYSTAAPAGQTR